MQATNSKVCLVANIYDIPKTSAHNSHTLTNILTNLGYKCEVQIYTPPTKAKKGASSSPYFSARVKFESEAQLQKALATHSSF
jgi:hypothetical protein